MLNKKIIVAFTTIFFLLLSGCVPMPQYENDMRCNRHHGLTYCVRGNNYHLLSSAEHYEENGEASWYGKHFQRRRTSSGQRYNMYRYTAAHKSLPLNTKVLVTNLSNGKKVVVTINDRGPFVSNRLIDLSYAAAKKIGMVGRGIANVKVETV